MKIVLGSMTFGDQVDEQNAKEMIDKFSAHGFTELDTAYVYHNGKTELLLGQINQSTGLAELQIAGKANPSVMDGLTNASISHQISTSLERTKLDSFDLYYLHQPDLNTDIRTTLASVFSLYREGKFKRFALSNYAAWQVAEIVEICEQEGWMKPVVYQGMYNALTRDIERELLNCLSNYNIGFYVYNPLAGGMLTGKHVSTQATDQPSSGRFATFAGYQDRYWKADYFSVMESICAACSASDIEPANAALRWLVHHSDISNGSNNAIIIGASRLAQFEDNLNACNDAALPDTVVAALDEGWEQVRPACIKYFRP
ncbi:MAG: aldo/keto reductase [Gammaproteobacteria bacterium]|nr:aldo/keto reductase [Gammaproteobacteria bacterium]